MGADLGRHGAEISVNHSFTATARPPTGSNSRGCMTAATRSKRRLTTCRRYPERLDPSSRSRIRGGAVRRLKVPFNPHLAECRRAQPLDRCPPTRTMKGSPSPCNRSR